jgi:hypothetical protein
MFGASTWPSLETGQEYRFEPPVQIGWNLEIRNGRQSVPNVSKLYFRFLCIDAHFSKALPHQRLVQQPMGSTCSQRWPISSVAALPAATRWGGLLGFRTLSFERGRRRTIREEDVRTSIAVVVKGSDAAGHGLDE